MDNKPTEEFELSSEITTGWPGAEACRTTVRRTAYGIVLSYQEAAVVRNEQGVLVPQDWEELGRFALSQQEINDLLRWLAGQVDRQEETEG